MSEPIAPILVKDVIIKDRGRSIKEYGDFKALAKSIEAVGLIHCVVLSIVDGKPHLVAGGRRMKAIKHLGIEQLSHGLTMRPGQAGFVYENELSATQRKEAELNENLHRHDMTWLDTVIMIDDIHSEKQKEKGRKWGQRETATLLGEGYGKTTVGYATKVADAIRKGDKEILKCTSLMEALRYLAQKKEESALAEMQRRVASKIKPMSPAIPAGQTKPTDISDLLENMSIPTTGVRAEAADKGIANLLAELGKGMTSSKSTTPSTPAPSPAAKTPIRLEPVHIPLSQMFILGDSLEDKHTNAFVMQSLPDAFIDHIVTDIPYGIDMSNLDEQQVASVKDQHDVEQNIGLMPKFLAESFRVIKPGGFCVFCFDLDHWNFIQATAKEIGWRVQDWPVIVCKTSPAKNQAPQYNTTKNYEVICYLRKDAKTTLRRVVNTSWRPYDFALERKQYNNPFAKPFQLWKDIYDDIAFTGQSVLDPYAGECSASRAAINCGLIPYGIEISEKHYNAGMKHLQDTYKLVHGNNCIFE